MTGRRCSSVTAAQRFAIALDQDTLQTQRATTHHHQAVGGRRSMIPFHPYANIFPLFRESEFAELLADMREYGIREKIKIASLLL